MPAQSSIPRSMDKTIVRKWLKGSTPQQIVTWIETTNHRRLVPVYTSRSSVERLLHEKQEQDSLLAPTATVLFLRRMALENLARLMEIQREYRTMADAEPKRHPDDERLARISEARKLQALRREEQLVGRMLRMAGVGVGGSQKLMEQTGNGMEGLEKDLTDDHEVEKYVDSCLASNRDKRPEELAALPFEAPPAPPGEGSNPENPVRFDDGSTGGTSEIPKRVVGDDAPGQQVPWADVPFLQDPAWSLTPEQREAWDHTKEATHRFLLAIRELNIPREFQEPCAEPLPPAPATRAGFRVAEVIPVVEMPTWELTSEQREFLDPQLRHANAWLYWLRRVVCEQVAGQGNWRTVSTAERFC